MVGGGGVIGGGIGYIKVGGVKKVVVGCWEGGGGGGGGEGGGVGGGWVWGGGGWC